MDEMWKEALERSIAKWNDIVYNDGVDNFGDNCALCQLEDELREDEDDDSCAGAQLRLQRGKNSVMGRRGKSGTFINNGVIGAHGRTAPSATNASGWQRKSLSS